MIDKNEANDTGQATRSLNELIRVVIDSDAARQHHGKFLDFLCVNRM